MCPELNLALAARGLPRVLQIRASASLVHRAFGGELIRTRRGNNSIVSSEMSLPSVHGRMMMILTCAPPPYLVLLHKT